MKDDAAIFAGAYSRRNLKAKKSSLSPPCAHENFVLIWMTGHAPDKALRAPSAPGIRRLHDTNGVLGVRLDWTVTLQPVCGIACQVVLEDFIVCATTEMRTHMVSG